MGVHVTPTKTNMGARLPLLLLLCTVLLLCNQPTFSSPDNEDSSRSMSSVGMDAVKQEVEKKNLVDTLNRQIPPGPFSKEFQVHLHQRRESIRKMRAKAKAEKQRKAKQGVSDEFLNAFHGFEADVEDTKDLLSGLPTLAEHN